MSEWKNGAALMRAKLSELQLPDFCPVCMEQADDLVPITAYEREDVGQFQEGISTRWKTSKDELELNLDAIRGAITLFVPCCAAHCGVRTDREKFVGICGSFLLLYPFLYALLGIISALRYGTRLLPPFGILVVILVVLALLGIYSFLPRSLERAFRIVSVNRGKGVVILQLSNRDFLNTTVEINRMHAEKMNGKSSQNV